MNIIKLNEVMYCEYKYNITHFNGFARTLWPIVTKVVS